MHEFKNLLIPIDLSGISERLVAYGLALAEKLEARIHLIFVLEDIHQYAGLYVPHPSLGTLEADLKKEAQNKLKDFEEEHVSGKTAQSTVLVGDPTHEIIRYASDNDIDLIVMGTHGRKGLDRFIFGSVAEKVVKSSPIPVLTVNTYSVESA
ncbi:MAG: universal stress protein [Deltaproteobacteria bacterium]|nr:universal stress protein [Deltaproteobacteria bacterium]